jgi:hypothetical protein
MAREVVREGKREDSFEKCLPPKTVAKRRGRRFRKEGRVNRRDLIQAAELGRGDLERRTESLFRGRAVNNGPGRGLRMIVSGRHSGIEMVAFKLMIGMTIMAQTPFQCLSSSGINEEKADQASSDSSHGNKLVLPSALRVFKTRS